MCLQRWSLCAGSEGRLWSLAPKTLLLLLSKLPCELADFPLELLGFLPLKYVLFVCPLKFSPSLSETWCLYTFGQLFSRNISLGRLSLPCQSHSSSSPALKACTAHGPHGGMSGRASGAATAGHSPSSDNTSSTQKVLMCNSSKWLCSSVSHHHIQSQL